MNDNRMKRWMDAIDDDLLEEAQRPLPRGIGFCFLSHRFQIYH